VHFGESSYGNYGTRAFIIAYSFVVFYIPCLLTRITFGHIAINLPSSSGESTESVNKRKRQRLLLRMCALTAAALTVCGFPSQTIYILSPFGVTKIGSPLHKGFNVLVFINSCINPLIYCFTNKEYRKEFKKLLRCNRGSEISPETELGSTQTHTAATRYAAYRRHIRLVWSRHGYFGSTASRQNTNHGSTKLAWYAAEVYQKGTIRYKYQSLNWGRISSWLHNELYYRLNVTCAICIFFSRKKKSVTNRGQFHSSFQFISRDVSIKNRFTNCTPGYC